MGSWRVSCSVRDRVLCFVAMCLVVLDLLLFGLLLVVFCNMCFLRCLMHFYCMLDQVSFALWFSVLLHFAQRHSFVALLYLASSFTRVAPGVGIPMYINCLLSMAPSLSRLRRISVCLSALLCCCRCRFCFSVFNFIGKSGRSHLSVRFFCAPSLFTFALLPPVSICGFFLGISLGMLGIGNFALAGFGDVLLFLYVQERVPRVGVIVVLPRFQVLVSCPNVQILHL